MKKIDARVVVGIISILLIAIIVIVALLIPKNNKEVKEEETKEEDSEELVTTEKEMEEVYDFSSDDAINAIKSIFNSDNYTFSAELRKDSMYVVTVTNTEDNSTIKYVVNPNDGSFSLLEDE